MRNGLLEKELEKVEESIRICKLNIENQEKRLLISNKKTATMQSKIDNINSLSPNEREELINIDNQLKYQTNLPKVLILEFQVALNFYEDKLQNLKSGSAGDKL